MTRPAAFAVERRRGWTETPESPARARSDMWDERRAASLTMEKIRPRSDGATRLRVRGYFAAFRAGRPGQPKDAFYEIVEKSETRRLENVQWADWDADGRLLVATTDGRLQIREWWDAELAVRSEVDLSALTPAPSPPPAEAGRW